MRALLIVSLLAAASCRDPRAEANIAQAMIDVSSTLTEIRQDLGDLHNQVDSLKWVAARQDTIIRQLANLAGVPVPRQ